MASVPGRRARLRIASARPRSTRSPRRPSRRTHQRHAVRVPSGATPSVSVGGAGLRVRDHAPPVPGWQLAGRPSRSSSLRPHARRQRRTPSPYPPRACTHSKSRHSQLSQSGAQWSPPRLEGEHENSESSNRTTIELVAQAHTCRPHSLDPGCLGVSLTAGVFPLPLSRSHRPPRLA